MAEKVRVSLDHPTGNFWVDMGLVVLAEHLGEGDNGVEKDFYLAFEKVGQGGWRGNID